jgi:hypothetical protein
LSTNESSTRAVLIDPVLRTLGWDTANPFMVEVEKTIDKGRVDYALLGVDQEIRVIVEAKKLNTDLDDKEFYLSLVNYAYSEGVPDLFLTDGLVWLHYNEEDLRPGSQEPTRRLSLRDDDLVEIAAYLVQRLDAARYWPEEKDVDELSQSINQLTSDVSVMQLDLAKLKLSTPEGIIRIMDESREPSSSHVEEEMTPLKDIGNATGRKPNRLRLPDQTIVSVRTWTEVLANSCMFTLERNPNIHIPLKDAAGKKVNLISLTRPPKVITYFEAEYQGKQVFVYTNYDSNNCIRNTLHILGQLTKDFRQHEAAISFSV